MLDKPPIKISSQEDLPILSHGHLPKPVADWALEISRCTGVCPTMSISMATGIVASLFQGHFDVEVFPGYTECLSYYGAVIAEPGERKTSVLKALMSPIKEYCREQRPRWMAVQLINEAKAKSAKKKIASIAQDSDVSEVMKHIKDIEAAAGEKQFHLEDYTSAALAQAMTTNNSILIATDEGSIWQNMGNNFNSDIGLLLRAHTAEPYVRNRKGEESSSTIDRPTASICMAMQPSVLSNSTNENLSGQGLVARFFIHIPEPKAGKMDVKYKPHDPAIEKAYHDWMKIACTLIDEPLKNVTHIIPSEGGLEILEEFSKWVAWESRVDDKAIPYEINKDLKIAKLLTKSEGQIGTLSNMRGWSSKLSGACARIAALRACGRAIQYQGNMCYDLTSDDAAHAVKYCIQSIEHMKAVGLLLRGEDWIAEQRAIAILNEGKWPIGPIGIGRMVNIIKDCTGTRAGVDRVIKSLCEKEWLIAIDNKTVRSNSNLIKVEPISTPVQLA